MIYCVQLKLNVRLCACVCVLKEVAIGCGGGDGGWRRLGCRTNRRHCHVSAGGTGVGSCRGWGGPTRYTGWRSGRETREPVANRGTTRSTARRKGNATRGRTETGGTGWTRWCETSPAACGPTVMHGNPHHILHIINYNNNIPIRLYQKYLSLQSSHEIRVLTILT